MITQRRLHLQLLCSPGISLPLKTERIGSPETMVTNYQTRLRNMPLQRGSPRAAEQNIQFISFYNLTTCFRDISLAYSMRCLFFSKSVCIRTPRRQRGCYAVEIFSYLPVAFPHEMSRRFRLPVPCEDSLHVAARANEGCGEKVVTIIQYNKQQA